MLLMKKMTGLLKTMIEKLRDNNSDNYSYAIYGQNSTEVILVDPVAVMALTNFLDKKNLTAKCIINTHSHYDHTGGNRYFGDCPVMAHPEADVPGKTRPLKDKEVLDISGVNIKVLYAPGHIPDHIILVVDNAYLISGDVLFLAGCGNTCYGGNVRKLFQTFKYILEPLSDNLVVCPGHDYSIENLLFAKKVEPDNYYIKTKIDEIKNLKKINQEPVSTLMEEKHYNPFFRTDSLSIRNNLKLAYNASSEDAFYAIRKARDLF